MVFDEKTRRNDELRFKYGKNYVDESREKALYKLEELPIEDEFDQKQQELVLKGINAQLSNNSSMVDLGILEREFVEANFIKDDIDLKRTKQEFMNVITFFVATGLLETISLSALKMRVNEEQFNRAYSKVKANTYTIGVRK